MLMSLAGSRFSSESAPGPFHHRKGAGILKVAKILGLGTGTVHRIKRAMAKDASFGNRPVNPVPAR